MTARLVLPHDAPREEWLAARRKGITASEIAVLLRISPYDSAFNLFWTKLGEIPEDYDNDAKSLGRHLEPWIADRWAADHPDWFAGMAGLWGSGERSWQLCTPDRLLYRGVPTGGPHVLPDPDESLLEIKSSGSYDGWGDDGTDQIPAYYRAQVLWQLDTLGLTEARVTCFFLATRQRRDYVVAYDDTDVMLMRAAAVEFLGQVQRREPPPIDHHPATTAALKQLNPKIDPDAEAEVPVELAARYRNACEAHSDWKQLKKQLENELRDAMGSAKYAVCAGEKVATRSIYTVAEHVRRESTTDKLIAAKTKEAA